MAQKAIKQQAIRNATTLRRTHFIALVVNALYLILRLLIFRASFTRSSLIRYIVLSVPAFAIELWLERIGRPSISANGEIRKTGEDLDAKGLTEYLWDVLYWSWVCTALAAVFGDRAWWLWIATPIYSIYLAYSTLSGMRQGMAGLSGQVEEQDGQTRTVPSNRQKKMEKRGGQRVQYR